MNVQVFRYGWLGVGSMMTLACVLYALRGNIHFFYTPSEIIVGVEQGRAAPQVGQTLRIGGRVKSDSVQWDQARLKVCFQLYDPYATVAVCYQGVLPPLFGEEQMAVVKGVLQPGNRLMASEVLAKHDEYYVPLDLPSRQHDLPDEAHAPQQGVEESVT